jgi:uncharacterized protein YjbJ (UPF0337 family)
LLATFSRLKAYAIQGISRDFAPWSPKVAVSELAITQSQQSRISQGGSMNWDQVEGKWKQASGKVKEKWGKLTDDDLQTIAGKRDQLVGRIQERYGIARDVAEKQVEEFSKTYGTDVETATVNKRSAGR